MTIMETPRVLNKHHVKRVPPDAVYVGRPSMWGNPFLIGKDGTREEVVERYRLYLMRSGLIEKIEQLRGKDLVCWCAPHTCHADTLLELANKGE